MSNLTEIFAGVFVVLLGIGILWALMLGFKQIGVYIQSAFRGKEQLTRAEAAEIRELAESVRMAAKATNGKDLEVTKK